MTVHTNAPFCQIASLPPPDAAEVSQSSDPSSLGQTGPTSSTNPGHLMVMEIQGSVCQGIPLAWSPPTRIIVNDLSLRSWGAHLGSLKIQSLWSEQEASLHINVLELQTIYSSCHTFQDHIKGSVVHILTDNTTTMYYMNRQRRSTQVFCVRRWSCSGSFASGRTLLR